jgi:hypothetical protein
VRDAADYLGLSRRLSRSIARWCIGGSCARKRRATWGYCAISLRCGAQVVRCAVAGGDRALRLRPEMLSSFSVGAVLDLEEDHELESEDEIRLYAAERLRDRLTVLSGY